LNATSVVITHDMASAFKISTKISMLLKGQIIYTGTSEEIRTTDNQIVQQFIQGIPKGRWIICNLDRWHKKRAGTMSKEAK
jgi:phospholipid/cholesterol/gamma-HCH transport system ATP-binding protein